MSAAAAASCPLLSVARQRFRASSRRVMQHPTVLPAHLVRMKVALDLAGAEPAQGALADFFVGCRHAGNDDKTEALDVVRARLKPHVVRGFEAYFGPLPFPVCSRLATRWSVLATASLDVPQRALRCSSDDSGLLARAAVRAWRRGESDAQREFLEHCLVCRDTLAFTLARRELMRELPALPPEWSAVSHQLQASVLGP